MLRLPRISPKAGSIALVSQSGALAVALIDQSLSLGIGYSQILSIGNKALMDEVQISLKKNLEAIRRRT